MLDRLFSAPSVVTTSDRYRLLLGFVWLAPSALFLDSTWLAARWPHGQWLTLAMVVFFFVAMLRYLSPEQRLLAMVFVPVGAVGEYVFSILFGLYEYRLENVPWYVPVGHPILLSMGWLLLELPWVRQHAEQLRRGLLALHIVVLIGVALVWGDTVSAAFAAFGVYIFRKRPFALIYGVMGLVVLYVELLGTGLGCWAWAPTSGHGWLHATNPPYGAFFGYVAADVLVLKIARQVSMRWLPQLVITKP